MKSKSRNCVEITTTKDDEITVYDNESSETVTESSPSRVGGQAGRPGRGSAAGAADEGRRSQTRHARTAAARQRPKPLSAPTAAHTTLRARESAAQPQTAVLPYITTIPEQPGPEQYHFQQNHIYIDVDTSSGPQWPGCFYSPLSVALVVSTPFCTNGVFGSSSRRHGVERGLAC